MKLFTLAFFTCMVVLSLSAQNPLPNPGFESWTNHGTYETPDGWTTTNPLTAPVGATTAVKDATPYAGNYDVQLIVKELGTIWVPGILSTGQIDQVTRNIVGGLADTSRPAYLTGWYKFNPLGADTASFEIRFFRHSVEIGNGQVLVTLAKSSWTPFSVPVTYTSGNAPDTSRVLIVASVSSVPTLSTTLNVDNVSYSSSPLSGIQENEIKAINLYPNPAMHQVFIDNLNMQSASISLFSYDGKVAKTYTLHEGTNQLDLQGLSAGLYLLNCVGKNGGAFRSKLVVE